MPFTVKATYRSETRKLSFPECSTFPSFDQLYHQLYRVFPISHSIVLSKLLFSPDSSNARLLLSREVRTAEEYALAVAPFAARAWISPLLRFSVSDETPHKLPAISHEAQQQASNPQKPVVSIPFPVAEPSFGRISYSHIPPPPIIFSSRPSPQEPMYAGKFETNISPIVPQHDSTSCCAVAQTKKDIQELITNFKVELDCAIASLESPVKDSTHSAPPKTPLQAPSSSDVLQSSPILSLPSVPMYPPLCQYNLCWRCGVLKQGPWFDCAKCTNKLCTTCLETAMISDCFFGGPHVWKKQTCPNCVPGSTPVLTPSPLQSSPWGPAPLNSSFEFPLLPSVPTMLPVAREEVTAETSASPRVPFAVPVAQNESVRNENGQVVHHGVWCDFCHSVIEGVRHKCLDCPDYDLCTSCITGGGAGNHNLFHEFFEISEPGRVVVHNVFSGSGEREAAPQPPRRANEAPAQSNQPVVHSATCDLCESRIRGDRYKCLNCPDWDCCATCFTITEEHHPSHAFVKISHPDDFIRRATSTAKEHFASCDSCSRRIRGIRYKCMHEDCPDFDLCSFCEALPIAVHPAHHPFLKIKDAETVIPTVYRHNFGAPSVIASAISVQGRSASPPPARSRAPSPAGSYEFGYLRNPALRADDISSPEIKPPSPFYFSSESVRSQTPGYQPDQSPLPGPTAVRNFSPVSARSPSPVMMIPGAMPTFFNLPPIESLNPFPATLLSEVEGSAHVLPPVQSTVSSGFWPENFQEIKHLMRDEPSFSRDLHQSAESRLPVEESPLIGEKEPLLTRPALSRSPSDTDRSVPSLATPTAPVPPFVPLPSTPSALEPLSAEFVADRNITDGQVIAPGAEFLKAWVMRNGGSRPWPEGTELVFVAGESFAKDNSVIQPQLVGAVQPNEQIDIWTGELKAPEIPGRYVAYYRLRDGEGNLFGHSIWLDISVSETSHTDSSDALASSEGYLSSSSIMVMPQGPSTPSAAVSGVPVSPMTAPSAHSVSDEVDISDNDSVTSGSLLSVPDSDSDEELWQDSRTSVFVERQSAESQTTLRETQQPDEYVVLYDDAISSEEE
ncbi:hypothetical protein DFJ43DRAFT_998241 [Lentinula guzmanii]|uniref:ZZ-type domain-containing protein n=1 Tax=Lentinula guzmanii TaxID=2804957 RepID=A0AA38N0Z5_9AGAR|nr:hypothetical protein DFJ43DRAFT_998241 [Lentinula guzmanii]